jgi:hypothetical protein
MPLLHLHFVVSVRRAMIVSQTADVSIYSLMRQDPFRLAVEIIADHVRLDVASLRWLELLNNTKALREEPDKEIKNALTQLVAEIFALVEVGGAEQQIQRFWASKGKSSAKVALRNDAPNRPGGHPFDVVAAAAMPDADVR